MEEKRKGYYSLREVIPSKFVIIETGMGVSSDRYIIKEKGWFGKKHAEVDPDYPYRRIRIYNKELLTIIKKWASKNDIGDIIKYW